ncbi:hypothetical protein C7M61_001236 [Candidozyma pseudohaemuli]|uniref:Ubiquitin-like 1-activating enzyme E1A n=1 Tax=Candidozyma pseudohaemuli TaxID=418784 RepID=A0A2P7Z009_9ASCO|nr:hypothetical protein C7M61_001236 [[Candida] pseudohaemulonii]PSK41551.1 hypothetical protein C7M61_001236 [[Candida] pseudohaemulonii]
MSGPEQLSADEIALYDRQIRLWGTDTQLRLRSARVLVVNLGGIGSETVKNLVLGGLNTIEILDGSVVKEEDFAAQFFLPNDDSIVGQQKLPLVLPKIQELNPRVNLLINTTNPKDVPLDYYKNFDLVVATELTKPQLFAINQITREHRIPLYVAGEHGMFGYIFSDLIEHTSTKESPIGNQAKVAGTKINGVKEIVNVEWKNNDETEIVTTRDTFSPLQQIFDSKRLSLQLNRRQLKRLSGALPLVLSLFDIERPSNVEDDVDRKLLLDQGNTVCESLGISQEVLSDEYLDLFSRQAFTEFSPVAAIIGGSLVKRTVPSITV